MTGKEVSLMEMLDARELRVHRQLSLQQKYASVLMLPLLQHREKALILWLQIMVWLLIRADRTFWKR